jgi:tripeptidyl-peptidase I
MIGCKSYSVPEYMREHVELIKPTVHFVHHLPDVPSPLRKRDKLGAPGSNNGPKPNGVNVTDPDSWSLASCDRFIRPDCLRALYNIHYYKPQKPNLNSYGIGVSSVDRLF